VNLRQDIEMTTRHWRRHRRIVVAGLLLLVLVITAGLLLRFRRGPHPVPLTRGSTPAGAPASPLRAEAGASLTESTAVVRWQPASSGPGATGYFVVALRRGREFARSLCWAPCTEVSVRGLRPPGPGWSFQVFALNRAGLNHRPSAAGPITVTTGCPVADVCLDVDTAAERGPALLRAQGFVHGLGDDADGRPGPGPDRRATAALHATSWRVQANRDTGDIALARSYGASVTVIVSDAWLSSHRDRTGHAKAPWSNWSEYRSWVTAFVRGLEARGAQVDYWDVQNEPGAAGYFSDSASPDHTLQQFLVAYQAIKAADPNAKVVGPSLSAFEAKEYRPGVLDLDRFITFCVRTGIRPDAISWHEDIYGPGLVDFTNTTENLADHIALARQLLRAHPSIGEPKILVNEYTSPEAHLIPGWLAGDIAALEDADVDQADHSCWSQTECYSGDLDGLLAPDGVHGRAVYWVAAFYGSMTGTRVPVHTSDAALTGFATRDPTGKVLILLGRHQSCTAAANPFCNESQASTPPPARTNLNVRLTSDPAHVHVQIAVIPNKPGVVVPVTVSDEADATTGNLVHVPINTFADGDAYAISITPS
jgi:hypothetical protein